MFTIAVTNSFNDTVTILPPTCELEGIGEVTFHNNPRLEFDGLDIKRNFDYHFNFELKGNLLHQELLPNNYFHYPRPKRATQYIKISNFNKEHSNLDSQIFIPRFYLATARSGEHLAITDFGLPTCDKVVIKRTRGARGSNQLVVPTNMLTTLLKHTQGLTLGEVKQKFPDLIYSDGSSYDEVWFEHPSDIFISELITGVTNEWRLLVGGGNIYARERSIKVGPYNQANLDLDLFHNVPEVKYLPIEDMFDVKLVETLHKLIEYIDLPIGSLDLFKTEDGKVGIFEFSTQYAFHAADPHFVRKLVLDGIGSVINKHR